LHAFIQLVQLSMQLWMLKLVTWA